MATLTEGPPASLETTWSSSGDVAYVPAALAASGQPRVHATASVTRTSGSTAGRDSLSEVVELRTQSPQLDDMERGQAVEPFAAAGGKADPHDPLVGPIGMAANQPDGFRTVDEAHHAVVAQQHLLRQLADRWSCRAAPTADGQQKLMLRRGDPGLLSAILRPPQVAAEGVPEGRKLLVLAVGEDRPV